MGRKKLPKVGFTNVPLVYSFLQASKKLNKDWRTIKALCERNNLEVLKINNRYYLTEEQIEILRGGKDD